MQIRTITATVYATTSVLHSKTVTKARLSHIRRNMSTPLHDGIDQSTTNDEDQREVAKIQARLRNNTNQGISSSANNDETTKKQLLPSVEIANGVHKYVLIKAELNGDEQYIVTSKKGAAYHRNAAEPMINTLEQYGYTNIEVTGGGRLSLNPSMKQISIYGYSYGFGLADHAISRQVILNDSRYSDYDITTSNEGY